MICACVFVCVSCVFVCVCMCLCVVAHGCAWLRVVVCLRALCDVLFT